MGMAQVEELEVPMITSIRHNKPEVRHAAMCHICKRPIVVTRKNHRGICKQCKSDRGSVLCAEVGYKYAQWVARTHNGGPVSSSSIDPSFYAWMQHGFGYPTHMESRLHHKLIAKDAPTSSGMENNAKTEFGSRFATSPNVGHFSAV